ncbi:MAG: SRPBCC domain-containing protein [Terriglobales bacterium]
MIDREHYTPGPARGARIQKDQGQNGEEKWTLVLVRELRHSPEKVWQAITDPAHLREWAPFDADGNLGTAGATVKLTTVAAPALRITETTVTRADEPELLEYKWGDFDMRWELEDLPLEGPEGGTRLTLWTNIGHRFIAMGAAGWHICFDVLDHLLSGTPLGRMVGPDAIKFGGWQRLHAEYAEQFGVQKLNWPPHAAQKS